MAKKYKHEVGYDFLPGDFVTIDGCPRTKAIVVCCKFRGEGHRLYDVEWMADGMRTATVEDWRLDTWEG